MPKLKENGTKNDDKIDKKIVFFAKGRFCEKCCFLKKKHVFSCLEGTKNASKSIEKTWKMLSEKGMKNVANMVPKWRQNGSRNRYKIKKYTQKCMPKSVQKNNAFQAVQQIQKNGPRCDLELIRDQRVEPGWWTFAIQGPQGAATSTRTRQKKEGERQKERRSKKERKGEW